MTAPPMLDVSRAAKRAERSPTTIRRWIRTGRLPAQRAGTRYLIEADQLDLLLKHPDALQLPEAWKRLPSGRRAPNWVGLER